ncbi:MAG: acyl-CoA carboxylase subunit beta [Promethearchaeota archaeon]
MIIGEEETKSSLKQQDKLEKMRKSSVLAGGEKRIAAQHKKGKLTARERISLLIDQGSFIEIDAFVKHQCDKFGMKDNKYLGDGVITGYGTISGRKVFVYSQDFTVLGGSLGEIHAKKICKIMDLALKTGSPVIGLLDSGGARIQEGVDSLAGYGEIFYRNVDSSGIIPQISVILGPCAGGAVYSPALTDFVIMGGRNAFMFVTGPEVVKSVTGEDVSFADLGGADVHSKTSGVCHLAGNSEEDALDLVKKLLTYLPSNNLDDPPQAQVSPRISDQDQLDEIVPENENEPYDMKRVINTICDSGSLFEIFPEYAKNLITGFARIDRNTVGIIANQPQFLGGAIDFNASDKGARFIRFCDAFNIPLITLVDVPGFMPGTNQEHQGIIRHGAKMLFAYSEATVPKITTIIRKSYGGAYIVMGSKHLKADFNLAWNSAQIAVMGAEGACKILYRKAIKEAEKPDELLASFTSKYKEEFSNPFQVAEKGHVDKVIYPSETRNEIIIALNFLENKRVETPKRKHGSIPL